MQLLTELLCLVTFHYYWLSHKQKQSWSHCNSNSHNTTSFCFTLIFFVWMLMHYVCVLLRSLLMIHEVKVLSGYHDNTFLQQFGTIPSLYCLSVKMTLRSAFWHRTRPDVHDCVDNKFDKLFEFVNSALTQLCSLHGQVNAVSFHKLGNLYSVCNVPVKLNFPSWKSVILHLITT